MNVIDVAFEITVLFVEVLYNYAAFLIAFLILLCSIFFTYYYFQIVRVSQNIFSYTYLIINRSSDFLAMHDDNIGTGFSADESGVKAGPKTFCRRHSMHTRT